MTVEELDQTLQDRGIALEIRGERLRVDAPAGALTIELLEALVTHKASLMTLMAYRNVQQVRLPCVAEPPTTKSLLASRAPIHATASLETVHAERDRLKARVLKGCEFLDALAARQGQVCSAYTRYFAEWEKINTEYKRLDDLYYALLETKLEKETIVL